MLSFTETDVDVLRSRLIRAYEDLPGAHKLYEGDPVRLVLLAMAYEQMVQNAEVENAANENLVAFATGEHLDRLGDLLGHSRRDPTKATVSVNFFSEEDPVTGSPVVIPQGTRVAAGELFFETTQEYQIDVGSGFVSTLCAATEAGPDHNGLLPGQVDTLVDEVAGIEGVVNFGPSRGGAGTEPDDAYRQRLLSAPAGLSMLGPGAAYEAAALEASPYVMAARAENGGAGVVHIYIAENGSPPQSLDFPRATTVTTVQEALNDRSRRPLTDSVLILSPGKVNFFVDIAFYIYEEYAPIADEITTQVETAVEGYIIWQTARLGRDVNPDELTERVMSIEGVKRIERTLPAAPVVVGRNDYAFLGNAQTVIYGGAEEE